MTKTIRIIFTSQPLNSTTKHEKWLQFYDGLISSSNVCKTPDNVNNQDMKQLVEYLFSVNIIQILQICDL